jgi:hypothetical protein
MTRVVDLAAVIFAGPFRKFDVRAARAVQALVRGVLNLLAAERLC